MLPSSERCTDPRRSAPAPAPARFVVAHWRTNKRLSLLFLRCCYYVTGTARKGQFACADVPFQPLDLFLVDSMERKKKPYF
jgi:hypothetical protein